MCGMEGIRKFEKFVALVLLVLTSVLSYTSAAGFRRILSLPPRLTGAEFRKSSLPIAHRKHQLLGGGGQQYLGLRAVRAESGGPGTEQRGGGNRKYSGVRHVAWSSGWFQFKCQWCGPVVGT
jgi:hypothetical protein